MTPLENALLLRRFQTFKCFEIICVYHDGFSVQNCVIMKRNVKKISIFVTTTETQGRSGVALRGHKKPNG